MNKHIGRAADIPYNPRIEIIMYADLVYWNSSVKEANIVGSGQDKCGLAPFARGFTAASPFIDFVDTGDRVVTKEKVFGMSCSLALTTNANRSL